MFQVVDAVLVLALVVGEPAYVAADAADVGGLPVDAAIYRTDERAQLVVLLVEVVAQIRVVIVGHLLIGSRGVLRALLRRSPPREGDGQHGGEHKASRRDRLHGELRQVREPRRLAHSFSRLASWSRTMPATLFARVSSCAAVIPVPGAAGAGWPPRASADFSASCAARMAQ